jgi:hypothetical protein
MKKIHYKILAILVTLSAISYANGLLMPSNNSYPKDFLRNTVTEVTVNIHGEIAETIVYQEFVNEWYDSTDAVYSFPLPPDARANKFLYWYNNKVYQAVLKVKEQAVNPGTGEGGVAAEVNKYIGRNGIKILLKGIQPGAIQKVELHYVSLCEYYQGRVSYNFPLSTGNFVTYPLDQLQFNINVNSATDITGFDLPGNSGYKVVQQDKNNLQIQLVKPKDYANQDFNFYYDTDNSKLGVDFYSTANDTMDGHFTLFVKPQSEAEPDSIFPRRIFFLLSNSSDMFGNNLNQSIYAISKSLDELNSGDYFNIIIFNYNTQPWKTAPVAASAENIQSAKDYLGSLSSSYGSDMNTAIKEAFNQIKDDSFSNSLIIFTNGRTVIDPKEIESLNTHNTGIFPIGIGDNLDRERMEMTAALNYGFVTYLDPLDNLGEKMLKVFDQISQPLLKNVAFEYGGAGVSQVIPEKLPSTYAGSLFFMTGRYKNSGESGISIAGTSVNGMRAYDFRLDFNDKTNENKFTESIWAKETIDDIERQIEVYGETPALKQRDIDISLAYNIRCRYTAYIADYETEATDASKVSEGNNLTIPDSYIAGNFPNPFNPSTKIRVYLDFNSLGKTKLIKIYNILGELVAVIDITDLSEGWHEVTFNGKNISGNYLASGVYLVQLQVGNRVINTIKINLMK